MADLSELFDDDDIDDDVLLGLPLEYPYPSSEKQNPVKQPVVGAGVSHLITDSDSGLGSNDDLEEIIDFPFPFEPYPIQIGFMQQLYKTLEQGKIGIFESPTGTGKSLSLICGALKWLHDHEESEKEKLQQLLQNEEKNENDAKEKSPVTSELDWVAAYAKQKLEDDKTQELKAEQELKQKRLERLEKLRTITNKTKRKRSSLHDKFDELFTDVSAEDRRKLDLDQEPGCENDVAAIMNSLQDEDDGIVLHEYHSDEEIESASDKGKAEEDHVMKIYYCSRTHSQLSQFIHEVQKSPFADSTRAVPLGSRQTLCINEGVKKLNSLQLINDKCIDMQKNKSKATKKDADDKTHKKKKISSGCQFYKHEKLLQCRDAALIDIKDIEQLVTVGKQMNACPYYSSRYAIPSAEIVALPYQTLLHKSTRESCGIRLKGNIVIVDEAHNLLDTISNIHSVHINGAQVTCAHSQLTQYMNRYQTRLKAKNLMYIKQILYILNSFIKILGGKIGVAPEKQTTNKTGSRMLTIYDFLGDTHLDNINLFKVARYCERSMIARKLHGFVEKYQPKIADNNVQSRKAAPTWALSNFLKEITQNKDQANNNKDKPVDTEQTPSSDTERTIMSSPLMHIQNFFSALTNTNKDGRILLENKELLSQSSIKFLLLNPAVYFNEVVTEPRALIVAGGTMQPLNEFKEQLFYSAGITQSNIVEYSCGHVIPEEQLLPVALARGSSGLELDFTYQNRDSSDMLNELGRVVYNVCNIVPGGVVVFFPSYEYEKLVYSHWEKNGFLAKITARKKIYREPKKAGIVESVLQDYGAYIKRSQSSGHRHTGAVLFCVVGGKMSEGINFSDDLGRCVLMVGLPYPSMKSPELKEKMNYLNQTMSKNSDGKLPGQVHYENLCMKAVNQSIGRAIRHKGDYATIMLLDHRYLRPSIQAKLPGWIQRSLLPVSHFGPAFGSIRKFFARK